MTKERIEQWWTENQEPLQAEVDDLSDVSYLEDSIKNAASCESIEDFKANLDEVIDSARQLFNDLKEIKDRVTF